MKKQSVTMPRPKKWVQRIEKIERVSHSAWNYTSAANFEEWNITVAVYTTRGVFLCIGTQTRWRNGDEEITACGYSREKEKKSRREHPGLAKAFGWDSWKYGEKEFKAGECFSNEDSFVVADEEMEA